MRLKVFQFDSYEMRQQPEDEVNEWLESATDVGMVSDWEIKVVEPGLTCIFLWYVTTKELEEVATEKSETVQE